MAKYKHVPAAFINAIAEEGTKKEAVEYLQEQWNETNHYRDVLKQIIDRSENGELGTSKVLDMKKLAQEALQ